MKEYKYKINGNPYTVVISDIVDNVAQVEVNGVPYKIEMEKSVKAAAPVVKPVAKPAAAPASAPAAAPAAQTAPAAGGGKVRSHAADRKHPLPDRHAGGTDRVSGKIPDSDARNLF